MRIFGLILNVTRKQKRTDVVKMESSKIARKSVMLVEDIFGTQTRVNKTYGEGKPSTTSESVAEKICKVCY